jgi:hypothetical protein
MPSRPALILVTLLSCSACSETKDAKRLSVRVQSHWTEFADAVKAVRTSAKTLKTTYPTFGDGVKAQAAHDTAAMTRHIIVCDKAAAALVDLSAVERKSFESEKFQFTAGHLEDMQDFLKGKWATESDCGPKQRSGRKDRFFKTVPSAACAFYCSIEWNNMRNAMVLVTNDLLEAGALEENDLAEKESVLSASWPGHSLDDMP